MPAFRGACERYREGDRKPPNSLVLWPIDGQELPPDPGVDPGPTPVDPLDQTRLTKLTGALSDVTEALNNPPSEPPVPTTGNGPASGEYFRITELPADTDGDGIYDWHEFDLGLSPAAADSNGNGVEDPWDAEEGVWDTAPTSLIISEYQADNAATHPDEDGDSEDWVEILNPTTATIPLDGWRLTDDADFITGNFSQQEFEALWAFPDIDLAPGGSLLVWASNKWPAHPLHTDFALNSTDDEIVLVNPAQVVVDYHQWDSLQVEDRSAGWGIDNFVGPADGRTRKLRFFGEPTPGEPNRVAAFIGVCAAPQFSPQGGIYTQAAPPDPVSISLPVGAAGSIRYTTDFSVPGEADSTYSSSLTIPATTIIRAQATAPDCLPSGQEMNSSTLHTIPPRKKRIRA